MATASQGGDTVFKLFLSLIIAPIFVGVIVELFAYWLNKRDDDLK